MCADRSPSWNFIESSQTHTAISRFSSGRGGAAGRGDAANGGGAARRGDTALGGDTAGTSDAAGRGDAAHGSDTAGTNDAADGSDAAGRGDAARTCCLAKATATCTYRLAASAC